MQESAAVVIVDFPVPRPGKDKSSAPAPHYPLPQHLSWTQLSGRIILARTIDIFEASPLIENIILVLEAGRIADAGKLCQNKGWRKITAIITNGLSRQTSVLNGLDALVESAPANVMIHDAARPLVTQTLLEIGLQSAQEHQATTAAVPVKDTIKQGQQGQITATLDRSQLWTIQTPQVFSFPLLRQVHHQAVAQHLRDSIDDAALLEQLGQPVVVFPGSYANIKINTAEDLLLAEALLQEGL